MNQRYLLYNVYLNFTHMEANKLITLQANQGTKTILDIAYNNYICNFLKTFDEDNEERWETYNVIIQSLIKSTKIDYSNEIKYRLTDGENINEVILDIINRQVIDVDGLVWFLKKRIEEYIEDDFMKRFYKL